MTTAAKVVWLVLAVMLMLSLLGASATTLISPGQIALAVTRHISSSHARIRVTRPDEQVCSRG